MNGSSSQDTLESSPQSLNPTRLTIPDALRLIKAAGGRSVTPESLQADIDAGMPTNADGTVNLIYYAAWLIREMAIGN
jgi:hypothetical protein